MKKPTSFTTMQLLSILAMAGVGIVTIVSSGDLRADVIEDCVGQPYGTSGCPLRASSSSSVPTSCGNGVLNPGEECDLGVQKNGFSNCTKSCKVLFCGDGLVSPGLKEECEPPFEEVYALDPVSGELVIETIYETPSCGSICTVPTCDEDGECAGGCKRSFLPACTGSSSAQTQQMTQGSAGIGSCGNGVVDGGEQCDDGNRVDIDACTNACRISVCGDGIAAIWEQCDDGNRVDSDACSNMCKSPACGDGVAQIGEECDDGNQLSNDACTSACKQPRCGDMIVQMQQGEECDDGNQIDSDGCTDVCNASRCGDAIMQSGEECDDGNKSDNDACTTQCLSARCGDSVIQMAEECDDGNKVTSDGCSNLCKLPVCGNGVREGEELCDDGNESNGDSCSNECKRPACGDGFTQPGEFCDDGNQNNDDNCTTTCRVPTCGDGLLHPREECDNGRNNSDTKVNACRKDCREAYCGDGVTDQGEECDGGDECTPECKNYKFAAPVIETNGRFRKALPYVVVLFGFGSLFILAFVFRSGLHKLIAKTAGERFAQSIDDIPLDQIEMPWHKW